MKEVPRDTRRTEAFRQGAAAPRMVLMLSSALLALTLLAALAGPGFDSRSADPLWLGLACLFLLGLAGAAVWLLRRRPVVLRVGPAGLDLPFAFRRPLPWAGIHRIRREAPPRRGWGGADWLVVDPSPGVLPDYRLASFRRLELWYLRHGGIRIPLHGLDADPAAVVASIERFRPVTRATG